MDIRQIQRGNAAWWNESADWYAERGAAEDIAFFQSGGNALYEPERAVLGHLAPWCKRAIHLQCSHGRDALSLLEQGASEVIGIDNSDRLLAVARSKSDALNARATWILSDVLDTPHELDGTANLVYTGKGATCWMLDLTAWAAVAARLLAPGGLFFLYESHPLDWVWEKNADTYTLDAEHGDYFSETPQHRLFSGTTQSQPHYRQWTLAETINSLIGAGLTIESLHEYPEPFWDQFPHLPPDTLRRLPHAFALSARKR